MDEEKLLKKQFIIHIVYNMIAFAIIFIAFGIFMLFMVKNITFTSVDKQLKEAKNEFLDNNIKIDELYKLFDFGNIEVFDNGINTYTNFNFVNRIKVVTRGSVLRIGCFFIERKCSYGTKKHITYAKNQFRNER